MYLNEAHNQREKDDLAMLIEEELRQSYLGVKNEEGVYITPAFPKVIYVLQEDNIHEGDKYWYLTEMAAKCSMKRLTPDYISEKIMKEMKDGNCYPVMGCRSALTVWHDENGKPIIKQVHGFFARLVQHECEHLDGIVFLENVKEKNGFATIDNINKYNLR